MSRQNLLVEGAQQATREASNATSKSELLQNATPKTPSDSPSLGHIDTINRQTITGWAWNPADPHKTLQIEIYENDDLLARVNACQFRPDLARAGIGTGRYGFSVHGVGNVISPGPVLISAIIANEQKHLRGSPQHLDAAETEFTARQRRRLDLLIGPIIEEAVDPGALDELYDFLQIQLKQVIKARSALAGRKNGVVASLVSGKIISDTEIWSTEAAKFLGDVANKYHVLEVPVEDSPRVSIIIPCHNNFELTYRCIESILGSRSNTAFEIVIVDDGSIDETMLAELLFIGAVRVVRHASAYGFLRAANAGAAVGRGEFLLFLNNDTLLREKTIDEMVRTFDDLPNIGIVGSKLINSDGTLQESGGIVQRLGNALNWGFGNNPGHPKYCYLRDVDYVSAASLMISRETFESAKGFDELYEPGFYEDTDLCFKVRHAGFRVVVQPLSEVVHHRGATCGTSVTGRTPKRHQDTNQRKFMRRWDETLATSHSTASFLDLEAERLVRSRAVFIDVTVPTPDRDGGSNVALTHMRLLGRLGFKVSFIPADNMANISPYTAALQRIGIECFHAPFTNSVEEAFRQMAAIPPDLIYLHRIDNAAPYIPLARKYFPAARLVYCVADLHFLRLSRQATIEDRQDLKVRADKIERNELEAVEAADFVIVHSAHEAAILHDRAPVARVSVVQWPFAVVTTAPTLGGRSGVAFVGGYLHQPNVDAAIRLASHIMPLVHRERPGLKLHLVGPEAPRSVYDLASDVVQVVGHAPDLALALASVQCTVAPLRYGAGIKGKVLTSFALGLPCVMSEIAAEGIPLPSSLAWLVGSSEAEMAERIIRLHEIPELAERMSHEGIDFIRNYYSESVILQQLAAAIGRDVAG